MPFADLLPFAEKYRSSSWWEKPLYVLEIPVVVDFCNETGMVVCRSLYCNLSRLAVAVRAFLVVTRIPGLYLYQVSCERTINSVIRIRQFVLVYYLTRVDEGRKCSSFLAIRTKARTVVGRGEEGPLCDPGSEFYWEGARE